MPAPEAVAADVTENWPAGVVTAATVDDALYGVPNEIDLYALNYNTAAVRGGRHRGAAGDVGRAARRRRGADGA